MVPRAGPLDKLFLYDHLPVKQFEVHTHQVLGKLGGIEVYRASNIALIIELGYLY